MKQLTVTCLARVGQLKLGQAVRFRKVNTRMMMQGAIGFLWPMMVRAARMLGRGVLTIMACRLLILVWTQTERTSGRTKGSVNCSEAEDRHQNASARFPQPCHYKRNIHFLVETGNVMSSKFARGNDATWRASRGNMNNLSFVRHLEFIM